MIDPAATYLAVQQDASSVPVDWPVFHDDWDPRGVDFQGAVFVLTSDGAQLTSAPWAAPTDQAADAALADLGLSRLTGWEHDGFGRRVATVARIPTPVPPQREAPVDRAAATVAAPPEIADAYL